MADQLVSQIKIPETGIMDSRPAQKQLPVYLVTFEDKKVANFVAVRVDEHPAYAKVQGFFSTKSETEIKNEFRELVKTVPTTEYTEVWLPWQRLRSIMSLV